MQEFDCKVVSIKTFQECLATHTVSESIQKKYEHILSSYECFTTNVSVYTPKSSHHHGRYDDKRVNRIDRAPKDFKKHLVSCLNKINDANYDKMFTKIRLLFTEENAEEVVNIILAMGSSQAPYMHYMISLIHDLHRYSSYANVVCHYVDNYIRNFFEKKKYLISKNEDDSSYGEFCNEQKHKTLMINMVHMLSLLWKKYAYLVTIDEVQVYNTFLSMLDSESDFDLVLTIILEMLRHVPSVQTINTLDIDALKKRSVSSKTIFTIEQIEDLMKKK